VHWNELACWGLLDGSVGGKGDHSNSQFCAVSCCELLWLADSVSQIRSIRGDAPYVARAGGITSWVFVSTQVLTSLTVLLVINRTPECQGALLSSLLRHEKQQVSLCPAGCVLFTSTSNEIARLHNGDASARSDAGGRPRAALERAGAGILRCRDWQSSRGHGLLWATPPCPCGGAHVLYADSLCLEGGGARGRRLEASSEQWTLEREPEWSWSPWTRGIPSSRLCYNKGLNGRRKLCQALNHLVADPEVMQDCCTNPSIWYPCYGLRRR